MNKNDIPTYDKMMWPTVLALKDIGGSASNQELLEKVMGIMGIPEAAQNIPLHEGSSTSLLGNRLGWARSYLGKAGALKNSERGIWTLTQYGRSLTESDMQGVKKLVRDRYFASKKAKKQVEKSLGESDLTESDDWKDTLLDVIKNISSDAFERLAQLILRESGFIKVEVTGRSGDGGIDGIGVLKIKLVTFQVLFQCKRYKGTVSAGAIRDFRGAMQGRTDKGLFITTGRFTPDAKKEASRDGAPTIDLIDGESLCDLLKDLNLGVETKMVEEITVQPDFFGQI